MLKDLRDKIDKIDDEISALYLKRLKLCEEIAKVKRISGIETEDKVRELEVVSRLTSGLTESEVRAIEKLYETVFRESKDLQTQLSFNVSDKKACLIGECVTKSFSKVIHESLGMRYDLKSIKKQDLKAFLESGDYSCFNVTMPYKVDVIPYLDELSGVAKKIGVVNTVMVKNGKKSGYNTDIDGLRYIFESNNVDIKGKKVAILGTGATSKTARYYFLSCGALDVVNIGRSSKVNYTNYADLDEVNILLNATPVGKNGYESLVDLTKFKNLEFVADVIYSPLKTKLLSDAESLGIPCEGGLKMLVMQALRAEEIWQNTKISNVDDIYLRTLKKVKNIVLIGMPSCGKSTLGKIISQKLSKKFIDIDSEIEKEQGKTIPEIIESFGEDVFRKIEAETILKFAYENNSVISLGGGAAMKNENVTRVKQNGFVVYVKRDLSLLTTDNRPLSQKYGNRELYAKRAPVYEAACDFFVENNGDVYERAQRIIDAYENLGN